MSGKKYEVVQRNIYTDSFDESDIPEGMTPEQYAEQRYCDGYGDIDDHTIEVIEELA